MRNLRMAALAALLLAGCNQTTQAPVATAQAMPSSNDVFRGTKQDVIRLAIRAIQANGWKLDQVNEGVGIVSFETAISMGSWSGIKANLILEPVSQTEHRVTGTAKQNLQGGQIAAIDLGESGAIVRQAIDTMRSMQPG